MWKFQRKEFIGELETFENVFEEIMNSEKYATPLDEYEICRFCGEADSSKFQTKAHFIPEFTGNKELFNFNECDDCNNKFSLYENSLKNFGLLNILLPIKGKKKFPIHRDNVNKTSTRFTDSEKVVTTVFDNNAVILDGDIIKVKRSSTSFIPIYVQKALTKLAISMMQKEDLIDFKTLISWLLDKEAFTDEKVKLIAFYNIDFKQRHFRPIAYLFKKKVKYACPQFTLVLLWGNYKIQIFIPCNPNDIALEKIKKLKLPVSRFLKSEDEKNAIQYLNLNVLGKTVLSTATHHHYKEKGSLDFLNSE